MSRRTLEDRFWAKVDKNGPNGCWIWIGAIGANGRGRFTAGTAYRVAYELVVGPIPAGLDIDHLCRVGLCVNPAHLEPVTHAENLRRRGIAITECKRGHPYDETNTYYIPYKGHGRRQCRLCREIHRRAWRTKNKEHPLNGEEPAA